MPGQRGISAYKQQAAASSERRQSGYANYLKLEAGDIVRGRFRGLFFMPSWQFKPEGVKALTPEWLQHYAYVLGFVPPEKDTLEDWTQAFMLRYKQIEPFIYDQHYCHGVHGKDAYGTCAKSWAAQDCVDCYLKSCGDKRISFKPTNVFTFQPQRKFHKLQSTRDKNKSDYLFCPAVEGDHCAYCQQGLEAKDEGVKYVSFADTHAGGVVACAERVSKRCGFCGIGFVKNAGWQCANPDCGEPLTYTPPPIPAPENWDPAITCPACKVRNRPEELVTCNKGCAAPRRCQLHDVDVIVTRTGGDKSTSYQFSEQFPAEPLPAALMKLKLPNYELAFKPKDINEQCRVRGLVQNPFTGQGVSAPPQQQTQGYDDPNADENLDPHGGDPQGSRAGDNDPIPY